MKTIALVIMFVALYSLAAFSAQVQLTWNQNAESDLAGYKVYYGTASGSYGAPVDVGNVTAHTLSLAPASGQTYFFALTAYDTSGNESVKSDEVSVFVPDSAPPAKPTGFMQRLIAWLMRVLGWS